MSEQEDTIRAAILALLSMHMPEVHGRPLSTRMGDYEYGPSELYVGCSCGKPLYVGHLTVQLTRRMVELAEVRAAGAGGEAS